MWGGGRPQQGIVPWCPASKVVIFSIEMISLIWRSSDPVWRLSNLATSLLFQVNTSVIGIIIQASHSILISLSLPYAIKISTFAAGTFIAPWSQMPKMTRLFCFYLGIPSARCTDYPQSEAETAVTQQMSGRTVA